MSNSKSILVVEDSIEIQEVLKMILEHQGFGVSIAGTGAAAIEELNSNTQFSLMLLDLTLPDMSGFELLEKIENKRLGESVPIILCSAASEIKQMKLPGRVAGILPKPFEIDQLLSLVEKHVIYAKQ